VATCMTYWKVVKKVEAHIAQYSSGEKYRKGVLIIWRAGRPSGWALPRILVRFHLHRVIYLFH